MAKPKITIYTSYHSKSKKLLEAGILYISISRGKPRWSVGYVEMPELAPLGSMLNMPNEEYAPAFQAMLNKLNAQEIILKLEKMAADAGVTEVALCCFEKPTDFCHRFMVSNWLEEETGIGVQEWGLTYVESERIKKMQFSEYYGNHI